MGLLNKKKAFLRPLCTQKGVSQVLHAEFRRYSTLNIHHWIMVDNFINFLFKYYTFAIDIWLYGFVSPSHWSRTLESIEWLPQQWWGGSFESLITLDPTAKRWQDNGKAVIGGSIRHCQEICINIWCAHSLWRTLLYCYKSRVQNWQLHQNQDKKLTTQICYMC